MSEQQPKRKRGRPWPEDHTVMRGFTVRLAPELREWVQQQAETAQIKPAEFIRRLVERERFGGGGPTNA